MKEKAVEIGLYGIGVIFLIIILYPLYFIVIASNSDPSAVMAGEVWFYPRRITIARAVGYDNSYSFTRFFKNNMGLTPKEFRALRERGY